MQGIQVFAGFRIFLFTLVLCLGFGNNDTFGQEVMLESFGLEEGLPSLSVYAIHLDPKGYLWAGTPEGLVRYDGDQFELIPAYPEPGSFLMEIWDGPDGEIWFQVMGGEVFIYKDGNTEPYPYNEVIVDIISRSENRAINAVTLDQSGTLHVGFNGMGYLRIDANGNVQHLDESVEEPGYYVKEVDGELFDYGIQLSEAPNPFLFPSLKIQTDGFQLDHTLTYPAGHQMMFLRSAYALRDGRYLMVSGNLVLEIFPDHTVKEHLFSAPIYDVIEDEEGRLLFSYLIGGTKAFTPNLEPLELSFSKLDGSRIGKFLSDEQGGYWIKSSNQGLYYLQSLDILRFGSQSSGKTSQILASCHDGQGTVFVSNAAGELLRIKQDTAPEILTQLPTDGSQGRFIQTMYYDTASQAILMATNTYNLLWQNGSLEQLPSDRYSRGFNQIVDLGGAAFWGVNSQAIAPFPHGNAQEEPPVLIKPNRFPAGSCVDNQGRVWITVRDSILRFEAGHLTTLDLGLPLDQPWVFWSIDKTRTGTLLIGGGQPGFLVIDGAEVEVIGKAEGLPEGITLSVFEVTNGDWWVVQPTGLTRMRKQQDGSWQMSPLSRGQGLLTPGIEGSLYDGKYIWVNDSHGLLRVDPSRVALDFPEAPLYLTRFDVGDSSRAALPAQLDRDENSITFHFQSVDFHQRGHIRYQYRLAGLEDDWVETPINQVRFPQLGPGQYEFEVRASTAHGTWGTSISQPFAIRPAFYETWWFLVLLVLLVGALLMLGFALVIRRLRRANQMRENNLLYEQQALNAQMNPHFVFNSLNSIQAFIVQNDSRNSVRYLSKFAKLMRNSLDASQARTISLAAEIELLTNYCELEKLRFGGGFEIEINPDPAINPDAIGLPTYLVQPHVENAIWHGLQHLPKEKQGHLQISFRVTKGLLICRVEDNGVGRTASQSLKPHGEGHQSHALHIVKKRLDLLQKIHPKSVFEIEIIDLSDTAGNAEGTAVEITLSVMPLATPSAL